MPAILTHLNVSAGGMPKRAVLFARVTASGVEGDRQKNLKYHGGPGRAVCLFSEELYDHLREQQGIDLHPGAVGENFTTRGLDLNNLRKGDHLRVGAVLIQLTDIRVPCRNLNRLHPELLKAMVGRSGWVARVVEEGIVQPGDAIELLRASTRGGE